VLHYCFGKARAAVTKIVDCVRQREPNVARAAYSTSLIAPLSPQPEVPFIRASWAGASLWYEKRESPSARVSSVPATPSNTIGAETR
jgi:hypothetical protein